MEHVNQALIAKLRDLEVPGFVVEVDPDEGELAGAFAEDALREDEALGSAADLIELGGAR